MILTNYKCWVGLGNIGKKYLHTRHNLGFIFLEILQKHFDFPEFTVKSKLSSSVKKNIALIKPETLMNNSGEAVLKYCAMKKIKPEEIIVIHDDLNLSEYVIKEKSGGSAGGHNGLRSITSKIGSDYRRIRLGIGHPGEGVAEFVLNNVRNIDEWKNLLQIWIQNNITVE